MDNNQKPDSLLSINSPEDIPDEYRNTPIGRLIEYHNLGRQSNPYTEPQLLIGMCIDYRKNLRIPDNFAYVIRVAGANLRNSEFKISFAVAVGGIRHIALVGHTQCGMVDLASRKEKFIQGLIDEAGWKRAQAEQHFGQHEPEYEIGDETSFILSEARRLRKRYPKIPVAPMIYRVEDSRLYLISE